MSRCLVLVAALAGLFASPFPSSSATAESVVELVPSSKPLQPASTFMIRFPEPMVKAEAIGKVTAESPLVFKPALPGTFTWQGPQRGIFRPAEPLPLATEYEVRLSGAVKTDAGRPLDKQWSQTISTPPMEITGARPMRWGIDPRDAPALPEFTVLFNTRIAGQAVEKYFSFVDSLGRSIPARVEQAAKEYHSQHGMNPRNLVPWNERAPYLADSELKVQQPPGNQVLVRPVEPLRPGKGWKMIVHPGLPASDMPLQLAKSGEYVIGDVQPYAVSASAQNYVDTGKRIVLLFSKSIDPKVTAETIGEWITVTPAPDDMEVELSGEKVEFSGSFELGKPYHVQVSRQFPSAEPLPLETEGLQELLFEPVAPRLYFEEQSTHQLSSGGRQFHLRGINVPRVRVTARLFAPEAVPQALEAWRKYERSHDGDEAYVENEPYRKVDVGNLPCVTVFDEEIALGDVVDESREIALDWDRILGKAGKGVVLLTAEHSEPIAGPRPGTQSIVQVTDLGVVWKTSRRETFLYVFSLATGLPLAGADLELVDDSHVVHATARTDAAGCARIAAQQHVRWLHVRHAGDQHLIAFGSRPSAISLTRFRLDSEGDEEESDDVGGLDAEERKTFLFTDRGAYLPGDTVHIKGIVRDFATGFSRAPEGARLALTVQDARHRTILERELTLSATGAFDLDVPISGTTLGHYSASVRYIRPGLKLEEDEDDDEGEASCTWQVQEFVPNAFEITMDAEKTTPVVAAEKREVTVELPVRARYYMGKPLSKAHMKWTLRAQDDGFAPDGFDEFSFCDDIDDYRLRRELGRVGDFAQQGETGMDSGSASVLGTIPLNTSAPQPRAGRLLCEITDINQQTVSNEGQFTLHSSDFYLGLRHAHDLVREGAPLQFQVIAVSKDGTPLQESRGARLRLSRIDWQTNRIETAGRAADYESTAQFTRLGEVDIQTQLLQKAGRKWVTPDEASLQTGWVAGGPGMYLLEALSRDDNGCEVITATTFHVYGAGQTVWNYRNPFQIDLVADKESYSVGDRARLLVKSPISGQALVTVERENVRRSFVTKIEGNAASIEVPLEDADAPNVYVSVTLLRGAAESPRQVKAPEYRVGYVKLMVERPAAKLSVYVAANASRFQPGEQVELSAEVLDHLGKPVPGAEVTLYAVDEGILSLTGYETPDPLPFFQMERALGVRTGLTLPRMLSEDPEDRDFANKGYLIGDKGGADRVRRNFLPCAFWAASLRADAMGRVVTRFIAPDGLTRYRLVAVAQTVKEQFGSAEGAFEVHKPVMIEPAPPRFANVGDQMSLRAVLHNTTDAAGVAEVNLTLDRTAIARGEVRRRVAVPAGGTLAVDFPVEFRETGAAEWKWSAHFTSSNGEKVYRDSTVSRLNVGYPTPVRRAVYMSRINAQEMDVLNRLPRELLDGNGTVTVSLTPSRLMDLGEAMRSLLHYPYGCVEQTTSSMLPWLTLRDLRHLVPGMAKTDQQVADVVGKGIDRLLSMQTTSGGLAYWPGGKEAQLWGSSYGGMGIALAKRAGYPVPEYDLDRICAFLSKELRGAGDLKDTRDLSTRCLAAYTLALAGKSEPAYHEVLYGRRDKLSMEDRAVLALAIKESKGPEGMYMDLLDVRQTAAVRDDYWFGCASREHAVRLLAWSRLQPESPVVETLFTEMLGGRTGGDWLTTQGNAWALMAIAEYVRNVERPDNVPANGTVAWGRDVQKFAMETGQPMPELRWTLSADRAEQPLTITNPDARNLFAEVRIASQPRNLSQPPLDMGYGITRRYSRLEDDGSLTDNPAVWRVGERVMVTVEVIADRPARYVAVEDPLPAIFEAVNPDFETQATVAGEQLSSRWSSDFHELREDRALFFRDYLSAGNHTIKYLARVRAAGTATAPAAKIEEMYHPDRYGQSATLKVTSTAWD